MSKKFDIRPSTKHLMACDGDHAAAWVLAAIEFATKIGGWKGRQRLAEACMVDIVTLDRKVKKLEELGYIMHPQREQKTIVYRVADTYQNDMYKHIKMICNTYQNDMFEHIKMKCSYNIDENNIENIIGNNNTHTQSACEGLTDIDTLFYELKNDLQNATQISEDAQRNFKKTPAEILAALDEFQRMQRISGVTTDTRRNYRTHFNNWMYQQIRLQNQNKRNNNNGNNNNELPARLRVSKPVGPAQSTCDF